MFRYRIPYSLEAVLRNHVLYLSRCEGWSGAYPVSDIVASGYSPIVYQRPQAGNVLGGTSYPYPTLSVSGEKCLMTTYQPTTGYRTGWVFSPLGRGVMPSKGTMVIEIDTSIVTGYSGGLWFVFDDYAAIQANYWNGAEYSYNNPPYYMSFFAGSAYYSQVYCVIDGASSLSYQLSGGIVVQSGSGLNPDSMKITVAWDTSRSPQLEIYLNDTLFATMSTVPTGGLGIVQTCRVGSGGSFSVKLNGLAIYDDYFPLAEIIRP